MRQTYILTIKELSDNGYVNNNIQSSIFRATCLRTQDIKLEPVLCTDLYNYILDLVVLENDGTPLTADYDVLINNYIKPYLIPEIEIKIIIPNANKITAKTVGKISDEFERSNEINQNKILIDELRNDAIYYKNRLIDYLEENTDLYPLYTSCDCDEKEGKSSTYSNSISIL